MKKFTSILMAVLIVLSVATPVFAADTTDQNSSEIVTSSIVPASVGSLIDSGTSVDYARHTVRITLNVSSSQRRIHFWAAANSNPDTQFRVSVIYPNGLVATLGTIYADSTILKRYHDLSYDAPAGNYTFVFTPTNSGNNNKLTGFVAAIYNDI